MNYEIQVFDTWNRRIATHREVPLLKATRTAPDKADMIEGVLPGTVTDLSLGYRIRVIIAGEVFVDALITKILPQWSDTRKLILDRFVNFHEVIEFEAKTEARKGNTQVSRAYTNRTVGQIVKDAINSARGDVHYLVDHTAYPDGAVREFDKFSLRKTGDNELEVGGITAGQWVDSARMDLTNAFAKDGDTIAGLVVDGQAWPDLRLMLIDSEETSKNSHGISIHPEVGTWTTEQYDASGYKVKADAARDFLQSQMDTKGLDFIELNPHKDATGAFDDRIDVFGRYLGFAYGGGECFNAAMIEKDHAEVFLFEGGKFHVPEMELKDYFSYRGPNKASIEDSQVTLVSYDVTSGIFEVLTALSYAAGGFIFSVDNDIAVTFRSASLPDRVEFFDPLKHGITLGSRSDSLGNTVFFDGNPFTTALSKSYFNNPSVDEYDVHTRFFNYFSISVEEDADKIVLGLLADVAYPTPSGEVAYLRGDASIRVGDILEFRNPPLRRLEREVSGEWDARFSGKLVGRVEAITHKIRGATILTTAKLTSPYRSVDNPISFIVRSQPGASTLFQFRLDEATVGLDLGFHLD